MWPLFLLLLWLGPVIPKQKTGSCSQPQPLCCPGTDYHCKNGSCYCDEFCRVLSDCCPDYTALCNPGDLHAGSLPPVAQLDPVTDRAAHTPKMVLQMVLRMRSPLGSANRDQDWVQSVVLQLLHTSLTRRPLSITVKGIRKEA
ncbi:somatomedin-B and thrombospondin type-1 domain-containing protein-like [Cricetulus griseus]|uniref:Somatomedin B domain containing 1 n=1 Tax=Cricetulus griseus TaxID=10029 RepID=A0A8C2QIT7_CRIGR|nr:somatomedin-B and thrombospondin type-1 domain-containing protein-like [Cricetulus griseus]XP_027269166.1 somatomedin-B and thrombospondin type-1 domain-containing protein-like [Cricetulus griseus]